jgi:LPXTG-motif cell wall-anchored protein
VYPYAQGGPVTYMEPGQPFFGMDETRGGWFRGSPELKQALDAGLPSTAPSGDSNSTFTLDSAWSLATGVVLALLAGLGLLAVRRRRTAAATAR